MEDSQRGFELLQASDANGLRRIVRNLLENALASVQQRGRIEVTTAQTGAFTICVLGEDPFGQALDATLAGETIGNQRVAARRISSPQMSGDCQILFISSSEANRLNRIIEALDKSAVLTVSDIPQFSQRGGMIQFVLEENRIRFEVNLAATQRAGLTLSSELLKVATVVRKNPHPGD